MLRLGEGLIYSDNYPEFVHFIGLYSCQYSSSWVSLS